MRKFVLSTMAGLRDARRLAPRSRTTSSRASISTSEELCAQAKKETLQKVIEDGNTVLTASGLEATEYNCQFLQVSKSKVSPGWLVGALCEVPDQMFPDLLTIRADEPTELDLVSIKLVDPATRRRQQRHLLSCARACRRREPAVQGTAQNHPCEHNPSLVR